MEQNVWGLDEKGIEVLSKAIVSNFIKSNYFTSLRDKVDALSATSSGITVMASCTKTDLGFTCQYPEGFTRYNTLVVGNKIHRDSSQYGDASEISSNLTKLEYRESEIFCAFTHDIYSVEKCSLYLQKVDPIQ